MNERLTTITTTLERAALIESLLLDAHLDLQSQCAESPCIKFAVSQIELIIQDVQARTGITTEPAPTPVARVTGLTGSGRQSYIRGIIIRWLSDGRWHPRSELSVLGIPKGSQPGGLKPLIDAGQITVRGSRMNQEYRLTQ